MVADAADMQVWLDTQVDQGGPSIVTPYVRSAEHRRLRYRVQVLKMGRSGRSEISQGGIADLPPAKSIALGQVSLTVDGDDHCEIVVTLTESATKREEYRFACPL